MTDDRSKLERVHVVVMSRSITKLVHELGACPWMDSPRVELHLARDLERIGMPFCVSPLELHECDEDAEPVRDRLTVLLNVEFNERNLQARRHVEVAQFEQNRPLVDSDGSVTRLFGTLPVPAIVCGGGPTLSGYYDWIRGRAESHLVVCASTSLAPLLAADIVPDVVMVVDPAPEIAKHFRCDLSRLTGTTLVYIPSTFPPVASGWPGPRVCAEVFVNHPGELFSGGSVVHAAVDLAVKLGAPEVYLLGMDFCYPTEESHVAGAQAPYNVAGEEWRCMTTNGLGERIYTDAALAQYRRVLEDYVSDHPAVRFYKLGRAGAPIRGAEWASDT